MSPQGEHPEIERRLEEDAALFLAINPRASGAEARAFALWACRTDLAAGLLEMVREGQLLAVPPVGEGGPLFVQSPAAGEAKEGE